ncbi:hypothetical protein O181_090286 [Austropuccinia psidii MF-1]|uniref:Integrase catalytic domain-containing protein n=1 Tax=Austropuccinia psidii MF-1 TaxID=1389203 RepID=A0A9Q3IV40_9BASI|nr:hypothetical protein [Austropuccinia psidii MF-1]
MDKLLDLLVSDIMGPFSQHPQGFQYVLTIRDHVFTYSIVYPLNSRSDVLAAILDAIAHLSAQLGISPKALQMNNAREFVSASFTAAPVKLGDMARAMLAERSMLDRFWQFAYALAFYLHNRLPNRRCPDSSPHQVLYGRPPSISTLYPFGERAIVHVPSVQPAHKLAARGVEHRLLKPLLASGGWLLYDPAGNQMIHLVSVIFPCFQMARLEKGSLAKGSLGHVLNMMILSQVPTELYFEREEKAISSVPLAKDI